MTRGTSWDKTVSTPTPTGSGLPTSGSEALTRPCARSAGGRLPRPQSQLHSTIGEVDHEVLDVAGAASYLGLSKRTFGELVLDDQIPHGHAGRRRTFTRPRLDLYLARAHVRPGDIAHRTGPSARRLAGR